MHNLTGKPPIGFVLLELMLRDRWLPLRRPPAQLVGPLPIMILIVILIVISHSILDLFRPRLRACHMGYELK